MARRDGESDGDQVTEAGLESFPASDPPAYNMRGSSEIPDGEASGLGTNARPETSPSSAIRQGMARQNVRIGSGHAPASGQAGSAQRKTGRMVALGTIVIACLILTLVLILVV